MHCEPWTIHPDPWPLGQLAEAEERAAATAAAAKGAAAEAAAVKAAADAAAAAHAEAQAAAAERAARLERIEGARAA